MSSVPRETADRPPPYKTSLSAPAAVVLAISFGLAGGYLDVLIIVFAKYCWHPEGYFRTARDFPWTVPTGHALLLLIPGLVVGAINCRPRKISLRVASWLFASLALWAALLRLPLYGSCTLLLAVGLGRVVANAIASARLRSRKIWYAFGGLLSVLGLLATASSGWQAYRENRAVAGLPSSAAGARNVVLIVWDTVSRLPRRCLWLCPPNHAQPDSAGAKGRQI